MKHSARWKDMDRRIRSGGGAPGGVDTQIQFNDSGAFGGDANVTYDTGTQVFSIGPWAFDASSGVFTSNGDITIPGGTLTLGNASTIRFYNSGDTFYGAVSGAGLTGNQTYTLPDATGTLALTADIPDVSGFGSGFVTTSVPAGNTVASTASETAFATTKTFEADTLIVGSTIRIRMFGVYGTTILAPTLRGKVKLGGVLLLDTGALTCVANLTNAGWSAEAILVVTSDGATGTIEAQGMAQFATAATTGLTANIKNTAEITIDTTASNVLTFTAQWSASDAANTITARQIYIEVIAAQAL